MNLSHLAILTLNGELTDVKKKGEHSCLIKAKEPIYQDLLEEIQMRIGAITSGCETGNTSGKTDFGIVLDILAEYDIEVVDVANILIDGPGHVWIQGAGYKYHSNKLHRLSLGTENPTRN